MRLLNFALELQFEESSRVSSSAENVYRAITGKRPDKSKVSEPGTHIKIRDKKVDIRWRFNECRISMEDISGTEKCVERSLLWLGEINKVAPIGKMSSTEVITIWLLPVSGQDFSSLELRYRERMIGASGDILKGTFDSSVILDIDIDGCVLHHQSGPMNREQLIEEYRIFEIADAPEISLFLWASIINERKLEYSKSNMSERISSLLGHCKYHSELFEKIWKGVL